MTHTPLPRLIQKEVLHAYAAEPLHDRATLEAYVAQFPEHAEALADLHSELMLLPYRQEAASSSTYDAAIDRAWSLFQTGSILETKSDATVRGLLAVLDPGAFLAIASAIDVNPLFLSRIRDRAVAFATIPAAFVERLAVALKVAVGDMAKELQQPPMVHAGQRFKSTQKPEAAAQISFDDAIRISHLTPEQQAKLRALVTG